MDTIFKEDVLAAYAFIKKIVTEFRVKPPTLMFGDDGSVGMYWDDDVYYVDVEVERGVGILTIYTRTRTVTTAQRFLTAQRFSTFKTEDIDQKWVDVHLSPFKES